MADEGVTEAEEHEHDGSTDERLDQVEAAVDRIEQLVSGLRPSHQEAEQQTEQHLDRGSTSVEAIQRATRAELDRRDREREERQRAEEHQSEHARLAEERARLREAPPLAPVRRATKLLGWGDGRE